MKINSNALKIAVAFFIFSGTAYAEVGNYSTGAQANKRSDVISSETYLATPSQSDAIPANSSPTTNAGTPQQTEAGVPTSTVQAKDNFQSKGPSQSQLFFLDAGPFHPQSTTISNGDYQFHYNDQSKDSFQVQAGWSLRLFRALGSWSFQEGLNYSSFQGPASTSGDSLRLNVLGINTSLVYSLDHSPVSWIIPFAEGGYLFSFYNQTGSTDLQSAQGSTGNWNVAGGLRFWVNKSVFDTDDIMTKYTAIPVYVVLKVQKIISNSQDVDFGSTNFLAGIALAL